MTKENDKPTPIIPGAGFFAHWKDKAEEGAVVTTQCTLHAMQRQAFQNFKIAVDLGGEKEFLEALKKDGFSAITKGLSARFGYVFLTMLPAGAARKEFTDLYPNSSPFTQAGLATLIETTPGAAFEVDAAKAAMTRAGVELSSKPLNFFDPKFRTAYFAAVVPYFCRNGLGWLAAFMAKPEGEIGVGQRFLIGTFAGAVSAPLDTVGSRMMLQAARDQSAAHSLASTVAGAAIQTIGGALRDPKEFAKIVGRGAAFRALPGGVAAVLFSDKGAEAINSFHHAMYDTLVAMGEGAHTIFNSMFNNNPDSEVKKPNVEKLSAEKTKDADLKTGSR